MAQFELNIYDGDSNVAKRFETDVVRWGIFLQALQLEETLKSASSAEVISAVNEFVKKIFPNITDADLDNADVDDVLNTFRQLLSKSKKIGANSKNVEGAE